MLSQQKCQVSVQKQWLEVANFLFNFSVYSDKFAQKLSQGVFRFTETQILRLIFVARLFFVAIIFKSFSFPNNNSYIWLPQRKTVFPFVDAVINNVSNKLNWSCEVVCDCWYGSTDDCRGLVFPKIMNDLDDSTIWSKNESTQAYNNDGNVFECHPVSSTKSNVPKRHGFNEHRYEKTKDGKAKRTNKTE